jgi:hypothetical protein
MSTQLRDQSIEGIAKDTSLSLGQGGAFYLDENDVTQTDGNYGAIQALANCVFSLEVENWEGNDTESVPLPAGTTIFGNFTHIELQQGKAVAYRNV